MLKERLQHLRRSRAGAVLADLPHASREWLSWANAKRRDRRRYPTIVFVSRWLETKRLREPVGIPRRTNKRIPGLGRADSVYLAKVDADGHYVPWDGSRIVGDSLPEEKSFEAEQRLIGIAMKPPKLSTQAFNMVTLALIMGGLLFTLFLLTKG